MSTRILLLIIGVWIGLVLGLSFLEAPLKFRAPGITTELGLGIGRLVFGALNKIEVVFSVFLLIGFGSKWKEYSNLLLGMLMILLFIVAAQSLYLLPTLNTRVEMILSGQTVLPSKHHIWYIIMEVVKLITLFIIFLKLPKTTINA